MGFSTIAFASIGLADATPPGAPVLVLARVGAVEVEARCTLPTEDSDGSPLSGITELIFALAQETVAGVNPFAGVTAENLASFAENNGGKSTTVFLVDADAGKLKTTRFGELTLGKTYWVAAVVKDDSVA